MTSEKPGQLLTCAGVARELGVSRQTAERIMRRLPKIQFEDVRRVYIRRRDLERYLNSRETSA